MNISSVTSASISANSSSGTDITSLEKQLAALQKKLQEEDTSKDDEKTKELKTQQLEAQIKLIEAQIQIKQLASVQKAAGTEKTATFATAQNQNTSDVETGSTVSSASGTVNVNA
jgi:hypothetical protein